MAGGPERAPCPLLFPPWTRPTPCVALVPADTLRVPLHHAEAWSVGRRRGPASCLCLPSSLVRFRGRLPGARLRCPRHRSASSTQSLRACQPVGAAAHSDGTELAAVSRAMEGWNIETPWVSPQLPDAMSEPAGAPQPSPAASPTTSLSSHRHLHGRAPPACLRCRGMSRLPTLPAAPCERGRSVPQAPHVSVRLRSWPSAVVSCSLREPGRPSPGTSPDFVPPSARCAAQGSAPASVQEAMSRPGAS